jgi:hypothetical protein
MTFLEAVAAYEGFGVAGAIPTRNNNPGDLCAGRFTSAHGADGVDARAPRFAHFPDAAAGFAAMRALLRARYVGLTVRDALMTYAPPSENNTAAYIDYVCKRTGLRPGDVLTEERIG